MSLYDVNELGRKMHEALSNTSVLLGQPAYPAWDQAEGWMIESTLNTVYSIISNPDMTAGICWQTWAEEKLRNKWSWGPEKDPANKKHPLLPKSTETYEAAFARLPWAEQLKDFIALGVVRDEMTRQTRMKLNFGDSSARRIESDARSDNNG